MPTIYLGTFIRVRIQPISLRQFVSLNVIVGIIFTADATTRVCVAFSFRRCGIKLNRWSEMMMVFPKANLIPYLQQSFTYDSTYHSGMVWFVWISFRLHPTRILRTQVQTVLKVPHPHNFQMNLTGIKTKYSYNMSGYNTGADIRVTKFVPILYVRSQCRRELMWGSSARVKNVRRVSLLSSLGSLAINCFIFRELSPAFEQAPPRKQRTAAVPSSLQGRQPVRLVVGATLLIFQVHICGFVPVCTSTQAYMRKCDIMKIQNCGT